MNLLFPRTANTLVTWVERFNVHLRGSAVAAAHTEVSPNHSNYLNLCSTDTTITSSSLITDSPRRPSSSSGVKTRLSLLLFFPRLRPTSFPRRARGFRLEAPVVLILRRCLHPGLPRPASLPSGANFLPPARNHSTVHHNVYRSPRQTIAETRPFWYIVLSIFVDLHRCRHHRRYR